MFRFCSKSVHLLQKNFRVVFSPSPNFFPAIFLVNMSKNTAAQVYATAKDFLLLSTSIFKITSSNQKTTREPKRSRGNDKSNSGAKHIKLTSSKFFYRIILTLSTKGTETTYFFTSFNSYKNFYSRSNHQSNKSGSIKSPPLSRLEYCGSQGKTGYEPRHFQSPRLNYSRKTVRYKLSPPSSVYRSVTGKKLMGKTGPAGKHLNRTAGKSGFGSGGYWCKKYHKTFLLKKHLPFSQSRLCSRT